MGGESSSSSNTSNQVNSPTENNNSGNNTAIDANNNGTPDNQENLVEKAIQDAKDAAAAAKKAIDDAKADGVVTPAEKDVIDQAISNAADKKADAQTAVKDLPDNSYKTNKDTEVKGIDVPETVTATDTNDVEAKIKAAQDAAAAIPEKADTNGDGIIDADEAETYNNLVNTAKEAKENAQKAVDGLPDGSYKSDKGDEVEAITIPKSVVANDQESLDKAIQEAKDAATAAQELINQAQEDGRITPKEKEDIDKAIEDAKDKKEDAQTAVDNLPDGEYKDGKADEVKAIDVPDTVVVTDKNDNGKLDTEEVADAKPLVDKAAEDKEKYDTELAKANADGKITSDEYSTLEGLKATADASHQAAQDAVDGIPEGTAGKADLVTRLTTGDAAPTTALPEVSVDTTALDNAIEAAKQSVTEANNAISGADKDDNGLITPTEKAEVTKAIDDVDTKKEAAQEEYEKIKAELTPEQQSEYQAKIDAIQAPEDKVNVNDLDADGYSDSVEDSVGSDKNSTSSTPKTVAEDLYNQAKAALKDAEDLKTSLGPKYNSSEIDQLQEKLDQLNELKEQALSVTQNVRTDDGKDKLEQDINALAFTLPEVNDLKDSVWSETNTSRLQNKEYGRVEPETIGTRLVDETGVAWRELVIPAAKVGVKNIDNNNAIETLQPINDWVYTVYENTHGGRIRYKVDNEGNLIIQIDENKAKALFGNDMETLKLSAKDGTELNYYLLLNATQAEAKFAAASIEVSDNEGIFNNTISDSPNISSTDDTQWSNIVVKYRGTPIDGSYMKLVIVDQATNQEVWSGNKVVTGGTNGLVTFNASSVTLEDGHTYLLKAAVSDASGNVDEEVNPFISSRPITIDTTAPTLNYELKENSDGTASLVVKPVGEKVYYLRVEGDGTNNDIIKQSASNKGDSYKDNGLVSSIEIKESDLANKNIFYFVADEAGNKYEIPKGNFVKLHRLTNDLTPDIAPNANTYLSSDKNGQSSDGASPYKATNSNDIIVMIPSSDDKQEFRGSINFDEGRASGDGNRILNLNTADGDDTISATYMYGKVSVDTGTGNDTFTLSRGIYGEGGDSSYSDQTVSMGEGDDKFEITGTTGRNGSMDYSATKVSMGSGNDIVSVGGTIFSSDVGGQIRSGYFDLGQGDDIFSSATLRAWKRTASGNSGSNVLNLGKGHDQVTINGDVVGVTLIASRDSSDIRITGTVEDGAVFYLGNGNDVVTIAEGYSIADVNVRSSFYGDLRGAKERVDLLKSHLTNPNANWYDGIHFVNSESQIASEESNPDVTAVTFGDRPVIHLGNGDNTLEISKGVYYADISSGNGKDLIKLSGADGAAQIHKQDYIVGTAIDTGAGNDRIELTNVLERSNTINSGDGNDVIVVKGVVGREANTMSTETTINGGEGIDELIWDSSNYTFNYGSGSSAMKVDNTIEQIQFNGDNNVVAFNFDGFKEGNASVLVYATNEGTGNKVRLATADWTPKSGQNYFDATNYTATASGTTKADIGGLQKYEYSKNGVTVNLYVETSEVNVEWY